jgi:fluoride exporter
MVRRSDAGDSHPELPLDPEPGPLRSRLFVLVGLGGAVGTAARYGLARWFPAGAGFPRGTLAANLIAAVVLGVLLETLARRGPDAGTLQRLRLLIGAGFCGGLSTYSTLAVETDLLVRAHRDGLAATYAIVTVIAGVAMAGLGIALAARLHRQPP